MITKKNISSNLREKYPELVRGMYEQKNNYIRIGISMEYTHVFFCCCCCLVSKRSKIITKKKTQFLCEKESSCVSTLLCLRKWCSLNGMLKAFHFKCVSVQAKRCCRYGFFFFCFFFSFSFISAALNESTCFIHVTNDIP